MAKFNAIKLNKIINWALSISFILTIIGILSAYTNMSIGSDESFNIWAHLTDLTLFGFLIPILCLIKIIVFIYLKKNKIKK